MKAQKTVTTAKQTEKTPKQISAHEYRKELRYLRYIMEKTHMTPVEVAAELQVASGRVDDISKTRRFTRWLYEMPKSEDGMLKAGVTVRLHIAEWTKLAAIAQRKGWAIQDTLESVLAHSMNNWREQDEQYLA